MSKAKIAFLGSAAFLLLILLISPLTASVGNSKTVVIGPNDIAVGASITPEAAADGDSATGLGGTMATFSFKLTNLTDKEFDDVTLNTNIPLKNINFIHDVRGASSLDYGGKTITVSRLHFLPMQTIEVSFVARLNFTDADNVNVPLEPVLSLSNGQQVGKGAKKQLGIKKRSARDVPSFTRGKAPEKEVENVNE